jgi:hypothetical protein
MDRRLAALRARLGFMPLPARAASPLPPPPPNPAQEYPDEPPYLYRNPFTRGRGTDFARGDTNVPPIPGGYYIRRWWPGWPESRVMYVGIAFTSVQRRADQQQNAKRMMSYDWITFFRVHRDARLPDLEEWERRKIREHDPPWNGNGGAGGRRPTAEEFRRMVEEWYARLNRQA